MQLAPTTPAPISVVTATTQRIAERVVTDPARGAVTTTVCRELQLSGLVDGRRYASFEDAVASARLLTAGAALGAAIVRESDGMYEVHKVQVRDLTRETWRDPVSGAERTETVGVRAHRFTAADVLSAPPAFVTNRLLVGVVDGDWAMQAVRDAATGREALTPFPR